MPKKTKPQLHCNQCGHDWEQRGEERTEKCPKCHRRDWNSVVLAGPDDAWSKVQNSLIDVQVHELREAIKLIEGRIADLEAQKR